MNRRQFLAAASAASAAAQPPARRYQVGAYYFPNFHADPRNEAIHGKGWTEWELVKHATPRFPGHHQPNVPLWGYEDESDPRVFARKIDAAADHGLNHFLFDWYWYDGAPFLQRGLENGFQKTANNSRLRFALMWANHDWLEIMPAKRGVKPPLIFQGAQDRAAFEKMTDYIVATYFRHPSHWLIDGKPYFSIYELFRLVEGLGGIDATRAALDSFRRKTVAAGFPGLHLNAVVRGVKILPGEQQVKDPAALLKTLGFDSTTSYVWIHHIGLKHFPVTPYRDVAAEMKPFWRKAPAEYGVPYHPNVTMGWDSSPRTVQSDVFAPVGYPYTPTLGDNTPEAFREALAAVKEFLDSSPSQPKIATINAWNEWTEGSYLEPDRVSRMGYLEAIRAVFG